MIRPVDNRSRLMTLDGIAAPRVTSFSVDPQLLLVVPHASDLQTAGEALSEMERDGRVEVLSRDAGPSGDTEVAVIRLSDELEAAGRLIGPRSELARSFDKVGVALRKPDGETIFADHHELVARLKPEHDKPVDRARFAKDYDLVLVRYSRTARHGVYRSATLRLDELFERIQDDVRILYAEPNYFNQADDFADDERGPIPEDRAPGTGGAPIAQIHHLWSHDLTNVAEAQAVSRGEGIVVAVVDGRCDWEHPALKTSIFAKSDEFEFDPDHVPHLRDHGTQVAGVIGARWSAGGNGTLGVAPNCKVLPLSVHTTRKRKYESRIAALNYLVKLLRQRHWLDEASGHVLPIERLVVNCSWKTISPMPIAMQEALSSLIEAGAFVVCSAGNAGKEVEHYPSDYPGCLSVAAVGPSRRKATYSNYGQNIDICAPGGEDAEGQDSQQILTLSYGGGARWDVGTSFAAPFVSAVVALMWSRAPVATAATLREALLGAGATDIYALNDEVYAGKLGAGLVNASRAVSAMVTS